MKISLRLVAIACLVAILAACSPGTSSDSSNSAAQWTYTDGSGTKTTLDAVPKRIVAHGNSAAALMALGIKPIGIYADQPVDDDLGLKNLDLEGIEILGEEWGTINVEALAALKPDLIVAEWWPLEKAYSGLEEGTNAASQRLKDIAPIAGPAQGPSTHQMIRDYEKLAASLGADLKSDKVKNNKARFEAALTRFKAAVQAKPDLKVLAVSPDAEGLYVAVPEHAAELSDFIEWGMNIVVPEKPDQGFEYWETLSWENAGKYQGDLVIIDERSYPANLEDAKKRPTWSFVKAAAADATAIWPAFWVRSYGDYAMALDRLSSAIEGADEGLV